MSEDRWIEGNEVSLLENGEEFYPRLFAAIEDACEEVLIETFIVFEDGVGSELRDVLVRAARRGVRVLLHMDEFGSGDLSDEYVNTLADAGVEIRWYGPAPSLSGLRPNLFRRLHRKLAIIDGRKAFVGGINYSEDQLKKSGPQGKQDYAVEASGPVVAELLSVIEPNRAHSSENGSQESLPGDVAARVVQRDNGRHVREIENEYRRALRSARRDVVVANAYFVPGYRLFREFRNAARRGVRVRLIIQASPDEPVVLTASKLLYDSLLEAGVEIYEYSEHALHAKVAVVDDHWATVGSSNLDPLSLFLNLEANLVVRDRDFNEALRASLSKIIGASSRVSRRRHGRLALLGERSLAVIAYHSLRYFPSLAQWLPGHAQRSVSNDQLRARGTPVAHVAPTEKA